MQGKLSDHEALYDIGFWILKLTPPPYGNLHYPVSASVNEVTSDVRFRDQLNCDFRKFAVNLISLVDERHDV